MNNNWLDSVYSDGSKYFVSNPTPKCGDKITIALQMLENQEVLNVYFQTKFNGVERPHLMKLTKTENGLSRYEIEIQVFEKEYRYLFLITTPNCVYHYNELGITTYHPDSSRYFRLLVDYEMPEWVKNAVFYQIFPERFCNGDPSISVKDNEYTFDGYSTIQVKDWSAAPKPYSEAHCLDFYGGDLIGIKNKIPYFKKLGITALYINPIFYGATVHKYDCLDYFTVDPHFGGDKAFEDLCKALHENGLKIILDVSINHTGTANKWFNKEGIFFPKSVGAYNNPSSKERDYYFFNEDNTYKSWFGIDTLPTLNYTSESLKKRLYKDPDSLVKKWLSAPYNIDGWRFDVADTMARNNELQLHHEIWPEIRNAIKSVNPNAYILAEDWSDCTEFLNGNEWDSPMNYFSCSRPVRSFFSQTLCCQGWTATDLFQNGYKMTGKDLGSIITGYLSGLPFVIRQMMFNLIDSHDVPRFHNHKNSNINRVQGSCIMLFTLPGCTNIYYGDECGIDGTTDSMEGCRYPMPWHKDMESTEEYKIYSLLIDIKKNSEVFKDGGFKILSDDGYTLCYARFTPDEVYITVASNEEEERTLTIDLSIFGSKFVSSEPMKDVFGRDLHSSNKDGKLSFRVMKDTSYLFKL